MTEEAQEQLFERYWLARKAVAAYELSEKFEDEQSFSTASSNSASRVTNLTIDPSEACVQAVLTGKTYIIKYISDYAKAFRNVPATFVTSRTLETLFTTGEGGSMATQQPPVTDKESFNEIIRCIETAFPVRYRARLASRLTELEKAVQEEEMDGRGISITSLHHFVEFLKTYPVLRCPAVSVTPERNIYAFWKSGTDRVFSIHFLADGNVRFVVFCPNRVHPGEAIRLSGAATADVLMSVAAPHGVLDWATDERTAGSGF